MIQKYLSLERVDRLLRWNNYDWNPTMVYNIFADTAKDCPAHLAKTSGPNDNKVSINMFGYLDNVSSNAVLA